MSQAIAHPQVRPPIPRAVAAAAAPRASKPRAQPARSDDGWESRASRWPLILVLAIHLLGGWMLLQAGIGRKNAVRPPPIMVRLVAAPAPVRPPPPAVPRLPPAVAPILPAVAPPNIPAAPVVAAATEAAPPLTAVSAAAAPTQVVAVPVGSGAPALKKVPPSALRYRAEPKLTMPALSRRLGESGIVYLRIVVDDRGLLKEASVKRSSGFARLDQQALLDIRSARFEPYLEMGQAIEWETLAPLSYELQ